MTPAPLWQRALEARLHARRIATAKARVVARSAHRVATPGVRCSQCNRGPANFGPPHKPLCRRHWLETLR